MSPEPDVSVHELDSSIHRCVIVASDGVWNMVSASDAIEFVDRWIHQRDKMLALVSSMQHLSVKRQWGPEVDFCGCSQCSEFTAL